jgi:plasmid stabilization system protein ParE
MHKVVILPLAKQDIIDAAVWYNSKQNGLGKRFTQQIRAKVRFIRENPTAYAVRYNNVRCSILDIFPFMIHYSFDEPNETIIISAIFHTALNPDKWNKR